MTLEEKIAERILEDIEIRREEAELARERQKICEILRAVFAGATFILIGGVDSPNWVMVLFAMTITFMFAIICHIMAQAWEEEADELSGYKAWQR